MDTVNYLLLYRGNSDEGGPESSVRAFSKLESAREAMVEAHRALAKALGIPVGPYVFSDPYTTRTKNGIRLDHYSDHFQWEIVEAVPEDGGPGSDLRRGLAKYTVTIEEHVAQEFSVDACDIFHAVQVGEAGYKRGSLHYNFSGLSEHAVIDRLLYVQECRNSLERCIGSGAARLRYRWRDGRVTETRFRRTSPGRIRVSGLLAEPALRAAS